MEKHRLSTTISGKHWELLLKHSNQYETQQKAIERSIEMLEDQTSSLSPEETLWLNLRRDLDKSLCPITRSFFRVLLENSDIDHVMPLLGGGLIHIIECHYKKPISKCSLEEVLDGIVIIGRMSNWFDSVDYSYEGESYNLRFIHTMSFNFSKLLNIWLERLFEVHGTKIESYVSEQSNFVTVYKM